MQALLDVKRAAALLGVTPRTVTRLVRGGKLPVVHIGRAARFEPEALEALVAANRK
jgi:excisionase family DNA binding protein